MNWNLRPILVAIWRSPTGALLVALQVALALAVLVNAAGIVQQRVQKVGRPNGMDTPNQFVVAVSGFTREFDYTAMLATDLAWLRGLPGVVAASVTSAVPLLDSGSSAGIRNAPGLKAGRQANIFEMDEQGLAALGVRLVAGRAFSAEEILPPAQGNQALPQILLTRALARVLFPDGDALGRQVYDPLDRPITVTGIIEHMHGNWVDWDKLDHVAIVPRVPEGPQALYLVRTRAGERDALMRRVEEHMATSDPTRLLLWVRSMSSIERRAYLADRNLAIFLTAVTAALLLVAALGIFGLATYNVAARTRQIGTRRALGARRGDIVRHFLLESSLVTTAGATAGVALALAAGYWLSVTWQLPRPGLLHLSTGVAAVWIIGLLAAWQPARRAAAVPPAVATRTV
ncbi:MAG: FtsX-like permease family protein [Gammaproteobacteria bacterium]|nr:MAG: FtsX-like permease family protein [Gammaproteobacteria bacterium]